MASKRSTTGCDWREKLARWTHVNNTYVREFLAEFLGSFILIILGNGAVAEVVLSKYNPSGQLNDFFSINVGYGLAVAFGVYISGGVSGGHINPAVSLAFAVMGKLKWIKLPIYMAAQYLGCFTASFVLFVVYYDAMLEHDKGERITDPEHPNATAGIFASYPQKYLKWYSGLGDQIFSTGFFMIGILAMTDERNTTPSKGSIPMLIGLLATSIGLGYGYNCGYPINPARDLAPRVFTSIAGWGQAVFSYRNYNWFWIPVVGPHIGAIVGVAVYMLFIGNQWPMSQHGVSELQIFHRGTLI